MNFKDMLLPVTLMLIVTFVIQYWFFGGRKQVGSATQTEFVAPKSASETKLLNKEIDFIDEKRAVPALLTEVNTDLAKYVFSTYGATLQRLDYKGKEIKQIAGISTVFPVSEKERENSVFLLAFDEKTPFFYDFVERKDYIDYTEIFYKYDSQNSDFVVNKKFVVYKNSYKVDVVINIEPKEGVLKNCETRLFFVSPIMASLGKDDIVSAVSFDNKGSFSKTIISKLNDSSGMYNPGLFGADSKYFVHAMVADKSKYAQRAYYKIVDGSKLFSILEGPVSDQKQSYNLSFYMGPKEEKAFEMVDPRLEKTLDYSGLLSIISKFMLAILKFLNNYVKNYGLAILLLTLIIRLLLFPFSVKAESGMKKRLEFQKKLDYLQKKYAHDKVALAQERAELIKKHGMPGLGGCLPILLQIPVFIALSNVLRSSIELYKAPFMFWIKDLSATDPYYILPILLAGSMLAQAFTVDPKQRLIMIASSLVIGPLFATMSAGISLYIFASVVLGLLQTLLIKRFRMA